MGRHSHSGMLVKQSNYGGKISKGDKRQVGDKRVTVKPTSSSSVVKLESDHSSADEFDLVGYLLHDKLQL